MFYSKDLQLIRQLQMQQNFSDYVLQKQLELQPQNTTKENNVSKEESMKYLSLLMDGGTDRDEPQPEINFQFFNHNKKVGESTEIQKVPFLHQNNKIQIKKCPFQNDDFQEIFKKSHIYQSQFKCPMQDFSKSKEDAMNQYSAQMEKINNKKNKEPKILDQTQRIDRCIQDAALKLKSLICENSSFYQYFDQSCDIDELCNKILQFSYGRAQSVPKMGLQCTQFKKLICFAAQSLRSCKVLSEQEIGQAVLVLEQYKDSLFSKKIVLQNANRVKQIETHFNDLVLRDELQNINKLYFHGGLYENHNVTSFLAKMMTSQQDLSRLRACHGLNLNEAQFYLFKHYYSKSLQACSLNLREVSLVLSYLEQTKNEIINKKDTAFIIIKDLDKQETLDNFCIMFEKSSKKYPELHKALRLHNQQATHNHLKQIFNHLLKSKMYQNYQLRYLHERCGISKTILKQFEATLQEILLNYKVHNDEIGLILQTYQKHSQPLQGKSSIYKHLKTNKQTEMIPNELQKKVTQDKKLIKLFSSDQESLFHNSMQLTNASMLKVLYSNHDVYSNQDLVFAHKDLNIENSAYDAYMVHFVETLKQAGLSSDVTKEMTEYMESKRKYIVQ